MEYNTNDYVIVNGKKYFAEGGEKKTVIPPEYIKQYLLNYFNDNDYSNWGNKYEYNPSTESKSKSFGMNLFNSYSPKVKEQIINNRKNWANYLKSRYGDKIIADDGYEVNIDDFLNTNDFDDENSRHVNGLIRKSFPRQIIGNYKKDKNGEIMKDEKGNPILDDNQASIPSGDNIFYNMLISEKRNNVSKYVPEEWEFLNKKGLKSYYNNSNNNKHWTRHTTPEGKIIYNFYTEGQNGNNKDVYTLYYDPDDKTWRQYSYDPSLMNKDKASTRKITEDTNDVLRSDWQNNFKNKQGSFPIMIGTGEGFRFNNSLADGIWNPSKKQSCGGRTSRRTYAEGGSMETPIPLGEQEDYNMVGAGGSHEINPQGGVPYGMNQDGSQNMVEEGEVSVGNNVFSDRIQLSPELCQQLGLPEGTTPAQAMQQIEQLYEQGQIGNDEFQEIQNIIFQDQESQKQGEEIQQEMPPNEGISPDMIQGANMPQGGGMPPEMMQQQGAPMTPQNEGIQPEMVQGYAYGGRMW